MIEGTPAEVVYGEESGEATKPGEGRQPREREGRDRRLGRGRRPQRERFGSEDRADDKQEEKAEQPQPAIEAPAAAARVGGSSSGCCRSSLSGFCGRSWRTARATRRPGRPRRTAAKDSGDDTPVAEAADSDA